MLCRRFFGARKLHRWTQRQCTLEQGFRHGCRGNGLQDLWEHRMIDWACSNSLNADVFFFSNRWARASAYVETILLYLPETPPLLSSTPVMGKSCRSFNGHQKCARDRFSSFTTAFAWFYARDWVKSYGLEPRALGTQILFQWRPPLR